MKKQNKKIEEKLIEKELEMYSVECLLENFKKVFVEIPENQWEDGYNELEQKIRTGDLFDAEQYGGSIKIEGVYVNFLNCNKIIGLIF